MKISQFIVGLVVCLLFAGLLPALPHAADRDRQVLEDLIMDLEKRIKEEDKRVIEHQKFLEELRSLTKQYRSRLRVVYFSEDFSDGDYWNRPTWVVDSGKFEVTGSRRLLSEVSVERPATTSPSSEQTRPLGGFIRDMIRTPDERRGGQTPPQPQEARIHTLAQIGPAFEIDLTLVSRSTWGSMEIVLLGGNPTAPLYRIVYQPSPSRERPIEIIRESYGKSYVIDTAKQYPSIDDGAPHRLQWLRDSQGEMRVMVDGQEILTTYEIYYRDNFTGLALVNKGGIYEWGPIAVYAAQEKKAR